MAEAPVPVLFPYLRAALQKLYSLPSNINPDGSLHSNSNLFATEKEAHDFLLSFQSRNIRRQFRSQEQRRRDQINNNNNQSQANETLNTADDDHDDSQNQAWQQGSTWLACIYLLCQPSDSESGNGTVVHSSEKTFAAQTLLHRLRRMDLKDAVDIEVESMRLLSLSLPQELRQQLNIDGNSNQHSFCDTFVTFITAWMQHSHTLLHRIILQLNLVQPQSQLHQSEDFIKGQMTASILPGLNILSAFTLSPNDTNLNPIVSTLGAAHSTSIIRFKYSTDYLDKSPPCRIPIPMITLLRDSIQFAAHLCQSIIDPQHTNTQQFYFMISKITCITLSTLPETIFSSAMSVTRGRFSIDPRCIQCGAQELRSITINGETSVNHEGTETGISLFQQTLQECLDNLVSHSQDNHQLILDIHKAIFMASERWVFYLPINQQFFLWIQPLLSAHLQKPNEHNSCQKQVYQFVTSLLDAANYTPDQIVSSTLGLVDVSLNANSNSSDSSKSTRNKYSMSHLIKSSKKNGTSKQSSRSKQRRKDKLNNAVTASPQLMNQAMQEHHERKEMGCFVTHLLFHDLQHNLKVEMQRLNQLDDDEDVDGEGIIGCVSSSSKACLPHLLSTVFQKETASTRRNNMNLHLIVHEDTDGSTEQRSYSEDEKKERMALFQNIISFCFEICGCTRNRGVRMFSYETLMGLHLAILDIDINDLNNNYSESVRECYNAVIENIYQCVMALASSCAYPANYFQDMSLDSDEEVENERNDVRDLIRSVTTIPDGSGNVADMVQHSSIKIIDSLVQACFSATANTTGGNGEVPQLVSETVIHALSALAKPLAKLVLRVSIYGENAVRIVSLALEALGNVCRQLISAFKSAIASGTADITKIFAVSRLASLATASFGRTFASVLDVTSFSSGVQNVDSTSYSRLRNILEQTLDAAMQAASISVQQIPELMTVSTLDDTVYDIRGAMRGPGGEDHVGCLALKRVIHENDKVAELVLSSYGRFVPVEKEVYSTGINAAFSMISHLCQMLEELKQKEVLRGPGMVHGQGVTPKSRRIMLQTVSQLGVIALKQFTPNSYQTEVVSEFHNSVSSTMQNLFYSLLMDIVKLLSGSNLKDEVEAMFLACECVFDLASFAPEMTGALFNSDIHSQEPAVLQGMQLLIDLLVSGYSKLFARPLSHHFPDTLCVQWGRLRCAIITLFRSCANPSLSSLAAEAILTINRVECENAIRQCSQGPNSTSSIFNDEVIGENILPAGAFIIVISEALNKIRDSSRGKKPDSEKQNAVVLWSQDSIMCLHQSREIIFSTLMILDAEPVRGCYIDPRPTMTEAWYICMHSLISLCYGEDAVAPSLLTSDSVSELLSDSCCVGILILLFKRIHKMDNRKLSSTDGGMMMDGPHTLALIQFLESTLLMGPNFLNAVGSKIVSKLNLQLNLDVPDSIYNNMNKKHLEQLSPAEIGGAVVGASLLRATSGGLPPWAVEAVPKLFSALFVGVGENADAFAFVMACALEITLKQEQECGFGGVRPGEKLAGRYVNNLGWKAKSAFLTKVQEAGNENNGNGWRKLKVALKAACGGKKKMSGFNLKPAYSCWECDRV